VRTPCFLLCLVWFFMSFVYFGLQQLTLHVLVGADGLRSAVYAALMELPGIAAAAWLVDAVGRPAAVMWCAATAVVAIGALAIAVADEPDASSLALGCIGLSRSAALGAYSSLYVLSVEIFPARVRATGLGVLSASSRIGGFLTSYVAGGLFVQSRVGAALVYAAACVGSVLVAGALRRPGVRAREADTESESVEMGA
jgi:hypothetical protein